MTIQLPVLLWTVISFLVLMLVLNKLLFSPLLTFMDARQAKIDRARTAREAAEKARQEAQQAAEEARRAAEKRALDEAQAALDEAHAQALSKTAQLEQAYAAQLAQRKAEMAAEEQAILQKLDAGMDALVSAFTEKLAR